MATFEWDEDLHPRGVNGQFISKSGSASGTVQLVDSQNRPVGNAKDFGRVKILGFTSGQGGTKADPWVLVQTPNGRGIARAHDLKNTAVVKAQINPGGGGGGGGVRSGDNRGDMMRKPGVNVPASKTLTPLEKAKAGKAPHGSIPDDIRATAMSWPEARKAWAAAGGSLALLTELFPESDRCTATWLMNRAAGLGLNLSSMARSLQESKRTRERIEQEKKAAKEREKAAKSKKSGGTKSGGTKSGGSKKKKENSNKWW